MNEISHRWNLEINNVDFMLFIEREENDGWTIFLSNLEELWVDNLTKEAACERCERLNPNLSMEPSELIEIITKFLDDVPKYMTEASTDSINLALELKGGIIHFKIQFVKASPKLLWEKVTKRICLSFDELHRRYKILMEIVKRKDEEIKEHRAQGSELIRKYIATKIFTKDEFQNNSSNSIDSSQIRNFGTLLDFYNEIQIPRRVKIEPVETNDKQNVEKSSQPEFFDPNLSRKKRKNKLRRPLSAPAIKKREGFSIIQRPKSSTGGVKDILFK